MSSEELLNEIEKTIDGSLSQELADIIKDALDKARAEGEVKGTLEQAKHYKKFYLEAEKSGFEAGRQSANQEWQKKVGKLIEDMKHRTFFIRKYGLVKNTQVIAEEEVFDAIKLAFSDITPSNGEKKVKED